MQHAPYMPKHMHTHTCMCTQTNLVFACVRTICDIDAMSHRQVAFAVLSCLLHKLDTVPALSAWRGDHQWSHVAGLQICLYVHIIMNLQKKTKKTQ